MPLGNLRGSAQTNLRFAEGGGLPIYVVGSYIHSIYHGREKVES
jgi:hypothetical protein